ncbi:threonine/serine dehydratase [Kribbella sp. CA-247076]|uniref:threonine/serine dehydratase n=1 Tax=Kribbella sp. CA-247076 TaxID=3239941 RepID=UPI003D9149FB
MTVSLGEVRAAAERIAGRVRRTPVIEVAPGLTFKLELLQHTGSFKPRGAFNRLLAAKETGELDGQGIVTASGGNAGLAAAYAARELGVRARIFVPVTAPAPKVAKLRTLEAEVVQAGNEYAEAYNAALQARDESGALLLHAYDQPEVVAGQGTVGLELVDQVGAFDTVLVAVGGGGLIAGIATAIGDSVRVVGVEPELAPTLHRALEAGEPTDGPVGGVAADSLGARRLGDLAFEAVRRYDVASLLVGEDAIVAARNELWRDHHVAVEHGAAVAYAALTSGAYKPAPGEQVVVVVCGANTDPATLGQTLAPAGAQD